MPTCLFMYIGLFCITEKIWKSKTILFNWEEIKVPTSREKFNCFLQSIQRLRQYSFASISLINETTPAIPFNISYGAEKTFFQLNFFLGNKQSHGKSCGKYSAYGRSDIWLWLLCRDGGLGRCRNYVSPQLRPFTPI